ncbi:MAG: hypothetical protein AAF487_14710 [Bacteroidota bacterium]
MKKISSLVLVFILANSFSAQTEQWKKLDDSNYSIEYPESWELNQSQQMGTRFILLSPLQNQEDKFQENINLIIQDLSGLEIDLDKYVEISEGQFMSLMNKAVILESDRMRAREREFHKIIYSGDQGQFKLKFEQYYWIIDEQAYVLTFTCESETFEEYRDKGEKILDSFRFKEN